MIPIWKDTTYTGVTADTIYTLQVGPTEVYRSKISLFPDGTSEMNLNRICENFLDSSLPDFTNITDSAISQPNACIKFQVYTWSGNTFHFIDWYDFLNDWSYEDYGNGDRILSNPINGHMDSRMKLFYTVYKNNSGSICYV